MLDWIHILHCAPISRGSKPVPLQQVINPQRACAAMVTVLGLCVCQSVCLSVCLDFAETTAFESEKLARSRTKLHGPTHQLAVHMRKV